MTTQLPAAKDNLVEYVEHARKLLDGIESSVHANLHTPEITMPALEETVRIIRKLWIDVWDQTKGK